MGKPISYIGHKVHCPKCKGDFPIIEGVLTTTFYGKGVALAGMKTSCGAVLIAGQFTDTVEWGRGSSSGPRTSTSSASALHREEPPSAAPSVMPAAATNSVTSPPAGNAEDIAQYDEQFQLKDGDDVILADMPYTIKLPGGQYIHGVTDDEGRTGRCRTEDAQYIEICLGHIDS